MIDLQRGFVLALRLPTPWEFVQYSKKCTIPVGTYISYNPSTVKLYKVMLEEKGILWKGRRIKVDESDLCSRDNGRFYYVCDRSPIVASSHRFYFSNKSTQMTFDKIMPASPLGFCKVAKSGKWGLVCIVGGVSLAIESKYDDIADISDLIIPGPGPFMAHFMGIGTEACIGERVDYYRITPNGHLHLLESLTKAQLAERSIMT